MAERHRSQDGHSETTDILGDAPENPGAPDHQGRAGGNLQRKVGTRDEKKRVDETSAGVTRALGGDRNGANAKEKV